MAQMFKVFMSTLILDQNHILACYHYEFISESVVGDAPLRQ